MLEDSLKLRLNIDKTRVTHVNDGFIFLGHRIVVTAKCGLSRRSARNFALSLTLLLSGNYNESKVDMTQQLSRKLKGWSAF